MILRSIKKGTCLSVWTILLPESFYRVVCTCRVYNTVLWCFSWWYLYFCIHFGDLVISGFYKPLLFLKLALTLDSFFFKDYSVYCRLQFEVRVSVMQADLNNVHDGLSGTPCFSSVLLTCQLGWSLPVKGGNTAPDELKPDVIMFSVPVRTNDSPGENKEPLLLVIFRKLTNLSI